MYKVVGSGFQCWHNSVRDWTVVISHVYVAAHMEFNVVHPGASLMIADALIFHNRLITERMETCRWGFPSPRGPGGDRWLRFPGPGGDKRDCRVVTVTP